MFGQRQSAVQQLIASAQVDSPVDIGALLRGSYDDELDLDASMDAGSELLTPSSLGEESEGSAKKRAARRAAESELDALRSENGALRRAALESESKRTTEVGAYQAAMEASQQRTREQLAALREAQQAMHAELPALREKLATTKAQISQLALLSTEQYEKLRGKPEEEVSVLERVQLRVHELVQQATREAQSASREAEAAARERAPPESPSKARRALSNPNPSPNPSLTLALTLTLTLTLTQGAARARGAAAGGGGARRRRAAARGGGARLGDIGRYGEI